MTIELSICTKRRHFFPHRHTLSRGPAAPSPRHSATDPQRNRQGYFAGSYAAFRAAMIDCTSFPVSSVDTRRPIPSNNQRILSTTVWAGNPVLSKVTVDVGDATTCTYPLRGIERPKIHPKTATLSSLLTGVQQKLWDMMRSAGGGMN